MQSLKPKLCDLRHAIAFAHDFDILAINETWLSPNVPNRLLEINGYQLHRCDRPRSSRLPKGFGGVGILVRDNLESVVLPKPNSGIETSNLECIWAKVSLSRHSTVLVASVYRHPTNSVQQIMADLDDFEGQIQQMIAAHTSTIILAGDFNVNLLDKSPGSPGNKFLKLAEAYDLSVCDTSVPTYKPAGSLLDAILTNCNSVLRSGVTVCHYSPHNYSRVLLKVRRSKRHGKTVTSRCLNRVDFDGFSDSLSYLDWSHVYAEVTPHEKWERFKNLFVPMLNSVAPQRTIKLRNPDAPYVSADTQKLLCRRRRALADRSSRATYKAINREVRSALRRDSRDHLRQRICETGRAGLWRCLKPVMSGKRAATAVPSVHPDDLNRYFVNVGVNTAAAVRCTGRDIPVRLPRVASCSFKVQPVSIDRLWLVLSEMKASSSGSDDGISVTMLQRCFRGIGPVLMDMINCSLLTGLVPEAWKHAIVTPLPKTSDLNDPSKFRPISVVPPVSKVLERVVHHQLSSYFIDHDLFSHTQHGYRRHHSTETALTEVTDRIFLAMDQGEIALLVLIDLSKCFDVINHDVLITKLKQYNVDTAWFANYLKDHTQQVKVRNADGKVNLSQSLRNTMGIYQGTSLGPLLFSIFSNDLSLYSQGANIYQFADDTQVLVTGKKQDVLILISRMEKALADISDWFAHHSMKVNSDKTQLIVLGSKNMLRSFPPIRIRFGESLLTESGSVKNLGLVMDKHLTFDLHIDQLLGKCTGILVALSHAKHSMPHDVLAHIVEALVMSSIRYCISIYGTHGQTQTHRIQKLINFCARVICGKRKYDHISAEIRRMQWLSASQLITYHRLCVIQKALVTGLPTGIASQLNVAAHGHNTRSHDHLQRPRARTNAGVRRLCFSGSDAYNRLPTEIRQLNMSRFKTRLKEILLTDV